MCGFFISNEIDLSDKRLESIKRTLEHRGPDEWNIRRTEKYCAIHTRLSIQGIDQKSRGGQPIIRNGTIFVYNGEIYNKNELCQELEKLGRETRHTDSDTWIFYELINKIGVKSATKKAKGMFSFVYANTNNDEIYFARDPFGQKPLYYYLSGSKFAAASSIKSLIDTNQIDGTIDSAYINDYIVSEGNTSPERTFIKQIKKALPGVLYKLKLQNLISEKYIDLNSKIIDCAEQPQQQTDIEEALSISLKQHLLSDVPVGLALSGGIDSTTLASVKGAEGIN